MNMKPQDYFISNGSLSSHNLVFVYMNYHSLNPTPITHTFETENVPATNLAIPNGLAKMEPIVGTQKI